MSAIHPKITEVLTHTFKVPAAEIHPGSTMDSLEMDSLAVAEFAVLIRETTGGDREFDQLPKDATLADISRFMDTAARSGARVGGAAAMSNAR
ncbi:acyl carrier protein [Streptomyces sp. NBC_00053]|uniref:acyl carrier protein n=1 Tax=unclassified Streptomyces TaxID=2593676 RepID=UPI000F5BF267|nr:MULTISPECIES: acyl carrier protein [unclassified Streptomyces]WSG49010.1 acyl carrier protein [Streptomyces sp. NBC_01732]WSW99663.1 acyl carrier protein [Streptomyces sp. NBC_00987]MCX4398574.1 acyl carrier protein [Streptomyces sp. NBC_01767]MCX5098721.1 acyl carrier protein [Streptomyces sp. NBC_00439]MCX5158259.1 acyl carrier protein [Streptomyces sp. NBC_00305]